MSYIFKVVFYQFSEEGVLVGFTQEKSIKEKLLPIKNPTTLNIYQEEQEGKMGKTASVKIMIDKFDAIFNHEYLGGYKFRLRPSL